MAEVLSAFTVRAKEGSPICKVLDSQFDEKSLTRSNLGQLASGRQTGQ